MIANQGGRRNRCAMGVGGGDGGSLANMGRGPDIANDVCGCELRLPMQGETGAMGVVIIWWGRQTYVCTPENQGNPCAEEGAQNPKSGGKGTGNQRDEMRRKAL